MHTTNAELRSRTGRFARSVVRYVRAAPVTFVYIGVLTVTSCVLATTSARSARRLLRQHSTNLHQLARDPVRVLVSSAFWLTSPWELPVWIALFAVVLARVEQRLGPLRMLAIFGIGHVGATLVTAGGLWLALRADVVEHSVVNARDVGVSYGFLAVAAVMTYLLDRRFRVAFAVALTCLTVVVVVASSTFTNFGHLFAALFGFACYPLARGAAERRAGIDRKLPAATGGETPA